MLTSLNRASFSAHSDLKSRSRSGQNKPVIWCLISFDSSALSSAQATGVAVRHKAAASSKRSFTLMGRLDSSRLKQLALHEVVNQCPDPAPLLFGIRDDAFECIAVAERGVAASRINRQALPQVRQQPLRVRGDQGLEFDDTLERPA